jgi:hypothetical protein
MADRYLWLDHILLEDGFSGAFPLDDDEVEDFLLPTIR